MPKRGGDRKSKIKLSGEKFDPKMVDTGLTDTEIRKAREVSPAVVRKAMWLRLPIPPLALLRFGILPSLVEPSDTDRREAGQARRQTGCDVLGHIGCSPLVRAASACPERTGRPAFVISGFISMDIRMATKATTRASRGAPDGTMKKKHW